MRVYGRGELDKRWSSLIAFAAALLLIAPAAEADSAILYPRMSSQHALRAPFQTAWPSCGADTDASPPPISFTLAALQPDTAQPLHAAAIEHSDAYLKRAKIHKYTSFATLPLFAAEIALGQSLYNASATSDAARSAHAIVGAGIVGLFGVNTVTGAWNLFGEGRREKDGRTLRLVHGLLMMAADVGFLATTAAGPNGRSRREAITFDADKATHRNLAIASISVGSAGYLLMLFGNH